MTTVNLIAAIGKRGQVGLRGGLPWTKEQGKLDLAWFRAATRGGVVVLGRRTYDQMATDHGASRPILPGRAVYPFGRTNTPAGLIKLIELEHPGWPIWIAGGPAAWAAFAPHITGLRLISVIDYDGEADSWFPFDAYGMELPPRPDQVPIPTNADQAAGMCIVGETWLRHNAPERLRKVETGVSDERLDD